MRFFSYVFTSVTVAASIATLWPLLMEADAAMQRSMSPGPVSFYPGGLQPFQAYHADNRDVAPVFQSYRASQCSLKCTNVSAQISGYTARVTVKQVFHNPNSQKFDAEYSFPLSNTAAVDEMTMRIGGRTIEGSIKKKAEARAVYAAAQAQGRTASLLEQQRTNVFLQSVANVEPGRDVEITLRYTDTLTYANGKYQFVFPTKVGPRFVPAGSISADSRLGVSTVYGGKLSLDVAVDGGMPISNLHASVAADRLLQPTPSTASFVRTDVPFGDDFELTWDVAADRIESGVVAQREGDHGYLTVMLMPPKRVNAANVSPKEYVFLIDCSGSQSGAPLQKAKDTMHYIVDHMSADDTFQIVAFSNGSEQFAPEPVGVSGAIKNQAHAWIDRLDANGGTMMAPAVERVCSMPAARNRLRIVSFMTDGYISNDYEVINLVKRLRGNSRWFPFGTGNSVNRALIEGIAKEGGGEPEYVDLNRDGKEVGKEFFSRIASPVLTDVKVRFEGISVQDVYPKAVSDVWAQKPLYFHARYNRGGSGVAVISGFAGGRPYESRLPIALPAADGGNAAIGQTWARAKIDDLMSQDLVGIQRGAATAEVENGITQVALQHHLVSQFTSFVAVDDLDKAATYGDPNVPSATASQCAAMPANVTYQATSPAQPTTSWNPFARVQEQAFNQVVGQLNALNSYSSMNSVQSAPPAPFAQPTNVPAAATDNLLRIAALLVMWVASLWMLLRKRQAKA